MQLSKYQEQPQLLDGFWETIVQPLTSLLRGHAISEESHSTETIQDVCQLLNVLISVRGYKTIVKFFPHEAADLERVLQVWWCTFTYGWMLLWAISVRLLTAMANKWS